MTQTNEVKVICNECKSLWDYETPMSWIVEESRVESFIQNHKKDFGCTRFSVTREVEA